MIISITSDLPSFKGATFKAGLNVVLADKFKQSDDKKTRNSAGKSSLIEIINFLYGAKAEKESLLRHPKLENYLFHGDIKVGPHTLQIARKGNDAGKIWISKDDAKKINVAGRIEKKTGKFYISNEDWKQALGHFFFDFPQTLAGSAFGETFTPGFRSLFSYFARRWNAGGFITPEKSSLKQARWDYQENLSYILGLDWRIPFDLQVIRGKEQSLKELKKAAAGGSFGQIIGTVGELRPILAIADAKVAELRDQLKQFRVMDAYRELSDGAAKAKLEMQAIERKAVSLKESLQFLSATLEEETPPQRADIDRVYAAIGIELPGTVRRRFEDVEAFHRSVVENRRHHLKQEIASLEAQLAQGEHSKAELDKKRSAILLQLEGKGALEDFLQMQQRLAALETEAANLRERYKAAMALESQKTELAIDRANVKRRLQLDHDRTTSRLDEFTLIISGAISHLYSDRDGGFVVEATDNGPEFRISIQGDRGGGISQMEIFCFDYALLSTQLARGQGPGFLIHDSHLFDGVDERQIASALLLTRTLTQSYDAQYIVTMNSDIYDRLPFPDGFDRKTMIAQPRLSDADEESGLFGFQF